MDDRGRGALGAGAAANEGSAARTARAAKSFAGELLVIPQGPPTRAKVKRSDALKGLDPRRQVHDLPEPFEVRSGASERGAMLAGIQMACHALP
jgi:hypothetical protein